MTYEEMTLQLIKGYNKDQDATTKMLIRECSSSEAKLAGTLSKDTVDKHHEIDGITIVGI